MLKDPCKNIPMEIRYLFIFFFSAIMKVCFAADTLAPNQSVIDGNGSLISSGEIFELGFFSPGKSKYRYLGIWYRTTPRVIVWVANRNNPLTDTFGELRICNNSNQLLLRNSSKFTIWSSNSSSEGVVKNPVAQLLDSGNLVLRDMSSEIYLWQSFDYPTDTLLAGMKFGWDLKTGLNRYLSSWKSADDPSIGDFTYGMDINGLPQIVLAMGSTKKFRTGTWNGVRFSGVKVVKFINGSNFT